MNKPESIGQVDWTNDDLRASLQEFNELYIKRPIKNNSGGMKSAHLFPTWWLLKRLQPRRIIESGTYLGQGTFFMREACHDAFIYSIEPRPEQIQYQDGRVAYTRDDFNDIDFSKVTDNSLVHFDDHQNAVERIKQMKEKGFKRAMFEDNYPVEGIGDCYSLKKAFQNKKDAAWLRKNLKIYYEFPPIFTLPKTRWGEDWSKYPTPDPLLVKDGEGYENWMATMVGECQSYTWICYVELR